MKTSGDSIRDRLLKLLFFLVPTQLGYHFWPKWAFIWGRRIDYLSPTIYLTDILILAFIALSLTEIRATLCRKPYRNLVLLTVFFLGLNIVFSVRPAVSLIFSLKILEYFLLGLALVAGKTRLPWLFFIFGTLFSGLIGIGQVVSGHSLGGIFRFLGERTFALGTIGIAAVSLPLPGIFSGQEFLRAYGTTPHPNVLGGILAFALYKLTKIYGNRKILTLGIKIIFIISAALLGLAIVLTFSRSAALALGAALLLLFRRQQSGFGLALLIFAVPLFSLIADLRLYRQTVSERLIQVKAAAVVISRYPVTGSGLGAYLAAVADTTSRREYFILQPVHNIFILFFSETGLAGLLYLTFVIRQIWSKISYISPAVIFLFVLALSDHYLYTLQSGQILTALVISGIILRRKL